MERKISFYLLSAKSNQNHTELSNKHIKQIFNSIIAEKMKYLQNGHKVILMENKKNERISIEVMNCQDNLAFLKIGQQKPNNTVSIRNYKTFVSTNIKMDESQYLEMCTYAMIDFENCVVSFIAAFGTPKVSNLILYFTNNSKDVVFHAVPILTKDVINIISNKHIIGDLIVKAAVPSDRILSEIGVSFDSYSDSSNIKTCIQTFEIKASRNKSLFKRNSTINTIVDKIKQQFGSNIDKITIKAKNNGEKMKTYNLESENFTKTVQLDEITDLYNTDTEFINVLRNTYMDNKQDIEEFIR